MKKISLKDLKNGLKRDEMRAIQGGGCGRMNGVRTPECGESCQSSSYCTGYCDYCRNGACGC